jgi:hypothetical protein
MAAPGIPDGGGRWLLNGSGALAGQGGVSVTGQVHSVGSVRVGHADGVLTIKGPHGSLTLDVRGPEQGAFAALPGHFQFTVRSGTGEYAHLHASGTIDFHLDRAGGGFTLSLLV